MSASQNLAKLRRLQALREHRSKSAHAGAVRVKRKASKETQRAAAKLAAHYDTLDHYALQGELHIDRFRILAGYITQSETEFLGCEEAEAAAGEEEMRAAKLRVQAEKQSEQLAARHSEALSKERRKLEEREAREFLSGRAKAQDNRLRGEKR